MKKMLFLLAAIITLTACAKDDDGNKENVEIETTYNGTVVVVDPATEIEFTKESVSIEVTVSEDQKSATIKMIKVQFAERMPAMDITIPDVPLTKTAGGFSMSGDGIIPIAAGGPFEQYRINGFTGEVTTASISFDMMCGTYPTSFSGEKTE